MKKIFVLSNLIFLIPYFLFSQNVGIGISPATRARLEVWGAVGSTSAIFGAENSGVSLQRSQAAIGFNQYHDYVPKYLVNGYAALQFLDSADGFMGIDVYPEGIGGAEIPAIASRFTISYNGNVHIGAGIDASSLCVTRAGSVNGSAVFGGSVNSCFFHYGTGEDVYLRGGTTAGTVYLNQYAGKVLMGNGNTFISINNGIPAYPLEIRQANGRGLTQMEPTNNSNRWEKRVKEEVAGGGCDLNLLYNGQYKCFFAWGIAQLYLYSDSRLKTNIKPLPSLLDKYMKLEPVAYEMKYHNSNHKSTIGFIAQDVQKLFPELVAVTTNTRNGYDGIDKLYGIVYNGFRILTIKVLQEQQMQIKKMQEQNAILKTRIEAAEKAFAQKK